MALQLLTHIILTEIEAICSIHTPKFVQNAISGLFGAVAKDEMCTSSQGTSDFAVITDLAQILKEKRKK